MKEISIEIGPRDHATINELSNNLKKRGPILYIDKRKVWLNNLKSKQDYKKANLIQGLAEILPLKDNSVSLIYARDFFGANNQLAIVDNKSNIEYEHIGIGHEKEWRRVCKKNGFVVVYETTDTIAKDAIKKRFENSGFKTFRAYSGSDVGKIYQGNYSQAVSKSAYPESFAFVFLKAT